MKMTEPHSIDVFVVHIPKTAGIALRSVFERWYRGKGGITLDYDLERPESVLDRARRNHSRVVYGHFDAVKYRAQFPEAKFISFLRDPGERLISEYWHQRTRKPTNKSGPLYHDVYEGKISEEQFIYHPAMVDQQTKMIRGIGQGPFYLSTVEEVYENLETLAYWLGNDPDIRLPNVNVNKSRLYKDAKKTEEYKFLCAQTKSTHIADYVMYKQVREIGNLSGLATRSSWNSASPHLEQL